MIAFSLAFAAPLIDELGEVEHPVPIGAKEKVISARDPHLAGMFGQAVAAYPMEWDDLAALAGSNS